MTSILQCDLCVVGGGGAGTAAARAAAARGAKVVLVEKRALGGDYLAQTVPLQAFCAAARDMARHVPRNAAPPAADFDRLRTHVRNAVEQISRDYATGPLKGLGIEIIRGAGSFSRPTRFEAGGISIEAAHFILAVGSMPAPASLPGQELIRPFTLDDLLAGDSFPEDVVLLAASFRALMLAQALLRLGTKVTLITQETILPDEDPELLAPVLAQLARDGLALRSLVEITGLEPLSGGVRVNFKGAPAVEAGHLMLTGAPLPLVEGLGLKNAGITYGNSGILADASGRTSNGRVFVAGAAAGGPEAAFSSLGQAEFLVRRLYDGTRGKPPPPARFLATEPPFATVGLSEAAAQKKTSKIKILRAPFSATAEARLAGRETGHMTGHVKIVTDSAGHILGGGTVGPGARELSGILSLAIARQMTARDLSLVANAPMLAAACEKAALASGPQNRKVPIWRPFWPRRRK